MCLVVMMWAGSLFAQDEMVNAGSTHQIPYPLDVMPPCVPPSEKLEAMLANKNSKDGSAKLTEEEFESLNFVEHFIHAFYHPESNTSSGSASSLPKDILQKIPAAQPRRGDGFTMSDRQRKALVNNRDKTIAMISQCIKISGQINTEFKRMITNLDAYEMIPWLIEVSRESKVKDPYLVTLLCELMSRGYMPFIESDIYQQLYPEGLPDFSEALYKRSIPFTKTNYEKILGLANGYYNSKFSALSEFVKIPMGEYWVGEKGHAFNPYHVTKTLGFEICRHEVTNRDFEQFVNSTGYITLAERRKDAFVWREGTDTSEWIQDPTANWRYPNGGSQGGIADKMDHPVTCISFQDAQIYCMWAKVRLPTVDEWEIASRGGSEYRKYFFGESNTNISEYANIGQGVTHPAADLNEGYSTTSPLGSFKPNPIGLYDVYGNVWEFCSDVPASMKSMENIATTRGGSWWCYKDACGFSNSIDIGQVQKEASFSNNGFRVVR